MPRTRRPASSGASPARCTSVARGAAGRTSAGPARNCRSCAVRSATCRWSASSPVARLHGIIFMDTRGFSLFSVCVTSSRCAPRARKKQPVPGVWQGVRWAWAANTRGGMTSRPRLIWRALRATVSQPKPLARWMALVHELHSREVLHDVPGEYLRAIRPYVHRGTTLQERVARLVDYMDWLESAFNPAAFAQIAAGDPLVLAELAPPRGYQSMRLALQHAPVQSPEGEMLLTLTLCRSADLQHKPQPIEVAALAFCCFCFFGSSCFVF